MIKLMMKPMPIAIIALAFATFMLGGFVFFTGGRESSLDTSRVQKTEGRSDKVLDGPQMVPHKALYNISMTSSSSGSQIVNITGNMYFEWNATCEAWTTDHRFNLTYEYTDSPAMHITSDFATWEAIDGTSFNFTSRRSRDGEIYEEIRGIATRHDDGGGVAQYYMPKELEIELPDGFVFPMQHTKQMIDHISNKSSSFFNRVLFDGSDLDGPVEVNAFLGGNVNAIAHLEATPKIDIALLNANARKVQMAFFPTQMEVMGAAEYEMEAVFHQNSVISDMIIDYDEFSIRQNLVALEALDASMECP